MLDNEALLYIDMSNERAILIAEIPMSQHHLNNQISNDLTLLISVVPVILEN